MTNLFIDLDDTFTEFSGPFSKFIDKPDQVRQPKERTSQEIYGISEKEMEGHLNIYGRLGHYGTQKLMPGARAFISYFTKIFPPPHFITSRFPDVHAQTASYLYDFYLNLPHFSPIQAFHLHMTDRKAQIISILTQHVNGFFIEDHPGHIKEVSEMCPNVITIWFNSLNYSKTLHQGHYMVSSWKEVGELVVEDFEELRKNSARPGVQQNIKDGLTF